MKFLQNKKLSHFALLLSVIFTSVSGTSSTWPSNVQLSNNNKSIIIQFKYLNNSNRTAEFEILSSTIIYIMIKNNNCTKKNLIKVLGTPTKIDKAGNYEYSINHNLEKAFFIINEYNQFTNYQIIK